ncbi:MAG: hypothetical protein CVU05_01690 [Bacteroidetes bacterium HGW-Bacteroidetes-21]|nr:MAG: hypothetical protein CVU05_01690 [Bacteroidetes bacterium HGW-Bacteroidetes-21]
MQKSLINKLMPHIIAVVVFLTISFIYFSPVLEGKKIRQSDMLNYQGTAKEALDYADENGRAALWTNSLFGGMPTYIVTHTPESNIFRYAHLVLNLFNLKPVNLVFLYLIGFYLALLAFGVNPWTSMVGSIAYAFSTYFFIIIEPGHITKAFALAYMPPIIGGVYLAFNKKVLLGTALMTVFLTLQIFVNHLQITYYTFMIVLFFGAFELYNAFVKKHIKLFLKTFAILCIGAIMAVLCNTTNLWTTWEYGKYSTRGHSELTLDSENKTTGLDRDYATSWSYGIGESMSLLIPNIRGGSSVTKLDKESETYQYFFKNYGHDVAKQACAGIPTYWGSQPFTSGPVYLGASVLLLFLLGMFLLKGTLRWWLLSVSILALLLSWGKHFMPLTDLFLDYAPGYNKFRAVSMILVIVEFAVPLLAIIFFDKLIKSEFDPVKVKKALIKSISILGGLTLLILLIGSSFFDFSSPEDARLKEAGYPITEITADRMSMLRSDAFRSLVFILLMGGLVFAIMKKKIKANLAIAIAAGIILIDLWPVDKRYVNNNNFITKKEVKQEFTPTNADKMILEDKDPNFRVFNVAVNSFNDASTSYYHKSIGGYSGAKMQRYQELIEYQIAKKNMSVLNMLNTKYFIVPTKEGGPTAQQNPFALGNAWFVDTFRIVANADSEIMALNTFKPEYEAIVDKRFEGELKNYQPNNDSTASILLTHYSPEKLNYTSKAQKTGLAVFSEIYYDKGWLAFIDGKPANYFRVNYVLRAMIIPEGNHEIEFRFEPTSYFLGEKVSLASSVILFAMILLILFGEFRKMKKATVV